MRLLLKQKNILTFATDIARPVSVVFNHLSEPLNFLGLQPLLIDVSNITETQTSGVITRNYQTTESFRFFGFIPYQNRIHVALRLTNPPIKLDAHVESPGGVTLDVEYHFTPRQYGTRLEEIVHVQSFSLLTAFVLREAANAQTTLLARLKERLESQTE